MMLSADDLGTTTSQQAWVTWMAWATSTVDDLNTIPAEILDEARRLTGDDRYRFLWEHVRPPSRAYLQLFIRDVVEGGGDAGSWGYGKILLPDISAPRLLASTVSNIVRTLGHPGEDGWLRVAPDIPVDPSDHYVGAPSVLRRDVKYLWRPPRGVITCLLGTYPKLRPVAHLRPAVRRWMAYRAAMVASFHGERPTDPRRTAALLELDWGDLSPDGTRALEALAAEAATDFDERLPPGFRGDDSLYG
jgi:hypothetical protein